VQIKTGKNLRGDVVLKFDLDAIGGLRWRVGTRNSIDARIAFVVQDEVVSMPRVREEVPSGWTELDLGTQSKRSASEYEHTIVEEMNSISEGR
jgi:preprotein translocase subunit SecD